MASDNDSFQDVAQQLQSMADGGGFDPFSLLTGESELHSIFLAPFAPSMQEAISQFLSDGSGPLEHIVEQFRQSGLAPAEAASRARMMLEQAQGMCVIVQENDQGLTTIPQLFFGRLDQTFIDHAVATCGEGFPQAEAVRRCLQQLAKTVRADTPAHSCFTLLKGKATPAQYWLDLAERLVTGLDDGILPGKHPRHRDLAFWISQAVNQAQGNQSDWDGDSLLLLARLAILSGHHQQANQWLSRMLADYEPEDETLLVVLEQWSQEAISNGQAQAVLDFLQRQRDPIDAILAGIYELELLRFKLLAANQADAASLVEQSEAMQRADRKSFRHDLGREPLWQVTAEDPGPCLDVAAAADYLDRSINFVAKRLDNRTLPYAVKGDEVVIPEQALTAWKTVMDHHRLID